MHESDAPEIDRSAEAPQHYPLAEGLQTVVPEGIQVSELTTSFLPIVKGQDVLEEIVDRKLASFRQRRPPSCSEQGISLHGRVLAVGRD
jgi:hypothetical protein